MQNLMNSSNNVLVIYNSINQVGCSIYNSCNYTFFLLQNSSIEDHVKAISSIINEFEIMEIICSLDLKKEIYEVISEIKINICLINRKYFNFDLMKITVNKEYDLSVRALNGLLTHLKDKLIYFEEAFVEDNSENNCESSYKYIGKIGNNIVYLINNQNYMNIDIMTNEALMITNDSQISDCNKSKKSLYGLLNYCKTDVGRLSLKNWLLHPLKNKSAIENRHKNLEKVLDLKIFALLKKILTNYKSRKQLESLYRKKEYFSYFKCCLSSLEKHLEIMELLEDKEYKNDIKMIIENINEKILVDCENDFLIKNSVDDELDILKEKYINLPIYLNEISERILSEYEIDNSVIYYPQLGYLIKSKKMNDELELKFVANDYYYYKNDFLYNVDNKIGDVLSQIHFKEKEIIMNLRKDIESKTKIFIELENNIATFDCYFSLAMFSKTYNCVKPKISAKEKYIEIQGIQLFNYFKKENIDRDVEIKITKNVIITEESSNEFDNLLYNLGRLVILFQIGSYLPCKKAEISVFHQLFTKIAIHESIRGKRSLFLSDVIQVSEVVKYGCENTLFLCDKFGKGTNIIDAISLFLSLINNLKKPLSIYTTHIYDLFTKEDSQEILGDFHLYTSSKACAPKKSNKTLTAAKYNKTLDERFMKYFHDTMKQLNLEEKTENKEIDNSWAYRLINKFIEENEFKCKTSRD